MKLKGLKTKLLPVIGRNKILYLSFLILIIMFFITRLPFFLYYPVVNFDKDTTHYYTLVDQMDKGMCPSFIVRTPGYPLFMKFVFLFFNKNISLIAVQNILSLLTCLFFVYVIHRVYGHRRRLKFLSLLSSIGMGAFISSSVHLNSDTSILTESLYVSFLVLSIALFILAIHSETKKTWIFCAISLAFVILIRPSAMFLIFIAVFILFFLIFNSYKKIIVFVFIISFAGILFLMCLYNYITIGSFTVSTFTEHALISITSTFLEQNPTYPSEINQIIKKCRERIHPARKNIIKNSWNYKKLFRVMKKYYNRNRRFLFSRLKSLETGDSYNLYMKWRPILKKIALNAIKNRPKTYFKYLYSNLMIYFFNRIGDVPFYQKLKERYLAALNHKKRYIDLSTKRDKIETMRLYITKEYAATLSIDFAKSLLKEYWNPDVLSKIKMKKINKKEVRLEPTFLQKVHLGFKSVHEFLFHNNSWIFIYFFTLIFSFFRLLKSRFHHKEAFIIFIMTFSALLHGIVVSMSAVAARRLAFPMNFVYYMSLFLFPILLDFDSKYWSKIKKTINSGFALLKKKR